MIRRYASEQYKLRPACRVNSMRTLADKRLPEVFLRVVALSDIMDLTHGRYSRQALRAAVPC